MDDALAAERGGANRIELCSALSLGGLTPSIGTLSEVKQRVSIPVLPMLRPRPAGFCYSDAEFATMQRDAELFLQHRADGVVFGILHADGAVDAGRCRKLLESCGTGEKVFHRAFDVTPDPLLALDELIDLGFTRVLTSGQQPTALEGADFIRKLIEHADGRIEILPGAGVRPNNVAELVRKTCCTQIHLSARTTRCDASTKARPEIKFSNSLTAGHDYDSTDEEIVHAVVETLRK